MNIRTPAKLLAATTIAALIASSTGKHKVLARVVQGYTTVLVAQGPLPDDRKPENRMFVRDVGSPPAPDHLTILTYNVQRFRWSSAQESVREAVERYDPTLLLFQEMPRDAWGFPGLSDPLDGANIVFSPFHQVLEYEWPYHHSEYGQATMSTHPLREPQVLRLPVANAATLGRNHILTRIAVYTEVPLESGRTLRVLNVHNEPFARGSRRELQFRAGLELLGEPSPEYVDAYCGDLNAFGRNEPGVHLLRDAGFEDPRGRGLDRCLFRGARSVEFEALPRRGSDHRPILYTVEF